MQHKECNQNGFRGFRWEDVNKVIDELFTGANTIFGQDTKVQAPLANVLEYEDHLEIEVAIPGFSKGDFSIQVEADLLTVSANRSKENVKENVKVQRKEFDYSTFKRSFRLTDKFDTQRITARYENGILRLSIPNKTQTPKESIRVEVL